MLVIGLKSVPSGVQQPRAEYEVATTHFAYIHVVYVRRFGKVPDGEHGGPLRYAFVDSHRGARSAGGHHVQAIAASSSPSVCRCARLRSYAMADLGAWRSVELSLTCRRAVPGSWPARAIGCCRVDDPALRDSLSISSRLFLILSSFVFLLSLSSHVLALLLTASTSTSLHPALHPFAHHSSNLYKLTSLPPPSTSLRFAKLHPSIATTLPREQPTNTRAHD